jgi:hypothetical protein
MGGMARGLKRSIPNFHEASMVKPELGDKHTCINCGARFFDFGKQPAVCPKCSTEQPVELPKLKRAAPIQEDVKKPIKAAAVPGDDVEIDDDVDADDADLLEDAEDIDDDAVIDADIEVERDGEDAER